MSLHKKLSLKITFAVLTLVGFSAPVNAGRTFLTKGQVRFRSALCAAAAGLVTSGCVSQTKKSFNDFFVPAFVAGSTVLSGMLSHWVFNSYSAEKELARLQKETDAALKSRFIEIAHSSSGSAQLDALRRLGSVNNAKSPLVSVEKELNLYVKTIRATMALGNDLESWATKKNEIYYRDTAKILRENIERAVFEVERLYDLLINSDQYQTEREEFVISKYHKIMSDFESARVAILARDTDSMQGLTFTFRFEGIISQAENMFSRCKYPLIACAEELDSLVKNMQLSLDAMDKDIATTSRASRHFTHTMRDVRERLATALRQNSQFHKLLTSSNRYGRQEQQKRDDDARVRYENELRNRLAAEKSERERREREAAVSFVIDIATANAQHEAHQAAVRERQELERKKRQAEQEVARLSAQADRLKREVAQREYQAQCDALREFERKQQELDRLRQQMPKPSAPAVYVAQPSAPQAPAQQSGYQNIYPPVYEVQPSAPVAPVQPKPVAPVFLQHPLDAQIAAREKALAAQRAKEANALMMQMEREKEEARKKKEEEDKKKKEEEERKRREAAANPYSEYYNL